MGLDLDLDIVSDFLNTLDERTYGHFIDKPDAERDEVATPAMLSRWLAAHGAGAGRVSGEDHAFVIRLRGELRRALRSGDAAGLNALARELPAVVTFDDAGAVPKLVRRANSARTFAAEVLFFALAATARGEWRLLKMCAAGDCHWVFHDQSRNHLGRWCNMDVCGNREKTRRYRARQRRRPATAGGR